MTAPIHAVRIPDLAGKAILVTGASTGIGAALCEAYAAQGCRIGLHFNSSRAEAEALASRIRSSHNEIFLVQGDFGTTEDVVRVVEETANHFGRLDGLVNNAGGMLGRVKYADLSEAQYEAVMNLNARSVITATRIALPWLTQSRGFVIHTSSIAARQGGGPGGGVYASSKAFVSNVARGQAKEFAPLGIRVNAVSPGTIATPFHDRYSTPEGLKATAATIPMQRLGTAEECVGAYLYLSSEAMSGYVTGQVIEVNGGQFIG